MALPGQSRRRRFGLGAVAVLSLLLITLDFQDFGPLGTLQSGVRAVVDPIRDGGETVLSPLTSVWDGATELDDIRAENDRLRAENDRLRGELVTSGIDREDYERLLVENGLSVPGDLPTLVARVKPGQIGNFSDGLIDVEFASGNTVKKNMAVVTNAGLVGRVEDVVGSSATIRLITDPGFAVGVEISGEVGLARGQASDDMMLVEQGISSDAAIEVGDPVLTSSSDQSLFPAQLLVGSVAEVAQVASGRRTEVTVQLSADTTGLRFVNIVLVDPDE